jgi:putative ATPase
VIKEMTKKISKPQNNNPLFTPPKSATPLAERIRPKDFSEFVGQGHLVGAEGTIRKMVQSGNLRSMILWGPPGTGKTTLARLIAGELDADFFQVNAISSGVKEMREIISHAKESLEVGRRTILFIDEIHRFNKAQQDALLQSVEDGTIILIGATTENPSFEVISPLLSRCQVYVLDLLTDTDLETILSRALSEDELMRNIELTPEAQKELITLSGSDARIMLNALEVAVALNGGRTPIKIDREKIREAYQTRHYRYDRKPVRIQNSLHAA